MPGFKSISPIAQRRGDGFGASPSQCYPPVLNRNASPRFRDHRVRLLDHSSTLAFGVLRFLMPPVTVDLPPGCGP